MKSAVCAARWQPSLIAADTELSEDMRFVNLIENPERYTGYSGESAHKIWHSVYKENCFECVLRRHVAPLTAAERPTRPGC